MGQDLGLGLQQSQSLALTKEMQQAIKLLQLSQLELANYIQNELLQNPLLDLVEETSVESPSKEEAVPSQLDFSEDKVKEQENDFEAESDPNLSLSGSSLKSESKDQSEFDPYYGLRQEETLRDFLYKQIHLEISDPQERLIAYYFVDQLDDLGYMRVPIPEIAQSLNANIDLVKAVLIKTQNFEPTGIFAQNLSECLKIQLEDLSLLSDSYNKILENLDLVAQKNLKALHEKTDISKEELIASIEIIQKLNPYPAHNYGKSLAQSIIPDLFLLLLPGGDFKIELNQDILPKVLVNRGYYQTLKKSLKGEEEKLFLQNAYQSANWLIKAIEQRANTLLKVAEEIVKRQKPFFEKGISYLRPMILKDIAHATSLHESTISRVTTNKYIATPRGNFELKYFFTGSLNRVSGNLEVSAESVKHRLKELIQNERYPDILSDDILVNLLRKEGIAIARRTITKYREALNIPSSVIRRQQKKPMNVAN